MSKIIEQKNQNALEFNKEIAPAINEITAPLQGTGVSLLSYIRIFNDGTFLRLSGDATWSQIYFENAFYNDGSLYETGHIQPNQSHYKIITGIPYTAHSRALCEYGLWHALVIYKKKKDYCDAWFFCTSSENDGITELYLNKIDRFKEFAVYFSNKAYNIIHENDPSKRIHTDLSCAMCPMKQNLASLDHLKNDISMTKYRFGTDIFFGKRELECIIRLLRGETTKEIGLHLNLSPRTVESYLDNVKRKSIPI